MNKETKLTNKELELKKAQRAEIDRPKDWAVSILVFTIISFCLGATVFWEHPKPIQIGVYASLSGLAVWYIKRSFK